MTPKISIITVCYNAADIIEKTILSVLGQEYENIEYIIIDGKSTDGTTDIIRKYEDKLSYFCSETDNGIFDAMNKGLRRASGEWISYMNAGDWFYNNKVVSTIIEQVSNQLNMIYGNTQYRRQSGAAIETALEPSFIRYNMPTSHQSFFIRTAIAKEIGFDLSYHYAADYNMVYQIYKRYGLRCIAHADITVSSYEAYQGTSMINANEVFRETLQIRDWSLNKLYGYVRYYIKRLIGRK